LGNAKKAAQVIAFLIKGQGGKADMIKTVKLAYMSDRRFLDLYDKPILNDDLYCLDHCPIDSMTLNLIKGQGDADLRQVWDTRGQRLLRCHFPSGCKAKQTKSIQVMLHDSR
jgi:hypothetical protein